MRLSVPYSSGQILQQEGARLAGQTVIGTFSPLFIGSNPATETGLNALPYSFVTFSPLFIGSNPATAKRCNPIFIIATFSPLFIGSNPATYLVAAAAGLPATFSPLFIGSNPATP